MRYMLLIIILVIIGIVIHTHYVKIETYKLSNTGVHLKIAHISDIHNQIKYINGSLSQILNRYELDFLIVTGDLGNNEKNIAAVIDEIKRVQVKQKIYFVLGNYERIGKVGVKKSLLKITDEYFYKFNTEKFKTLINEYETFIDKNSGARILFYGFDNSIYGNEHYDSKLNKEEFDLKILFAHSPNILRYIENEEINYDMLLVGHTHGNQVNIPGIKKIRNSYSHFHRGYKRIDGKIVNISRGLGTSRLPIRINSAPQVTLFMLVLLEKNEDIGVAEEKLRLK